MPRPKLPEAQRRTATEFTLLRGVEAAALTKYCAATGYSRSAVLRLALLSFAPLAPYLPASKTAKPRPKPKKKRPRTQD